MNLRIIFLEEVVGWIFGSIIDSLFHRGGETEEAVHPELVMMVEEAAIVTDISSEVSRINANLYEGVSVQAVLLAASVEDVGDISHEFAKDRLARCLVGEGFVENIEVSRKFVETL